MSQVQDSSDCCINSKFSSAQKGYFDDDFLSFFTKKLHPRSPIINRGYYIRFKAIDEILQTWWKSVNPSEFKCFQIISLGAGYDSSYLRLRKSDQLPPCCRYVEIDFSDVMKRKYDLIKSTLQPNNDATLESHPAVVFSSGKYSMLGTDLTDIPVLEKCLSLIGVDSNCPTLFVSECSITYIDPESSEAFIKWCQHNFSNSIFVTYEQIYPDDAFGLIMRNHFTAVGCSLKSITRYPDEYSQCKRFKALGWTNWSVITMYDLFFSLPAEEKQRIRSLEMFDEYEMWHEKCHHYFLLWASQGMFSNYTPSFFTVKGFDKDQVLSWVKTFSWKEVSNEAVQRYGHQVIPLLPSTIMISGGFGMVKKKHQRLGDISIYNLKTEEIFEIPLGDDNKKLMGNRIFHTMTKLSNNTVVVIGGRSSPNQVFDKVLVFHNLSSQVSSLVHQARLKEPVSPSLTVDTFSMPVPTWRHSATVINVEGTESIVVFGGCSSSNVATNGCFILNTETWKWSEVSLQSHTPCPRHSHSAVAYKEECIILTGGLVEDETILSTVHRFDAVRQEWCVMPVSGLLPRYSHTSHVWKDFLYLVGGVTCTSSFKLGVGIVNLKTLQAYEVRPPVQDPEYPILLCNHSSYMDGDEIFIVGGGGNCFSFGTHFNKKIVSFHAECLT